MRTVYILRTDDRPTDDLAFWKISNGHISATDDTICFMFGSRVGFSSRRIEWRYFRWDQIQDGGWPPSSKISNGHISETDHPIYFMFRSGVGFSGSIGRMAISLKLFIQSNSYLVLSESVII